MNLCKNLLGFLKIFVGWWDFERYWNFFMSLEMKSLGINIIGFICIYGLVRFGNVWVICVFFGVFRVVF